MSLIFANIDVAFKALAPRSSDWLSIAPEIAVAGLSILCLVQAMLLPANLRWLISATARAGLVLVMAMALVPQAGWKLTEDVATFAGLLRQN
ncbi:MAG: hypothetical protein D4R66_05150, partial [Opitutales bacterium]